MASWLDSDTSIKNHIKNRYSELKMSNWSKIHDTARKMYRFVAGDQWPEEVKSVLLSEERPPNVYNLVLRFLDLYVGINQQNQAEIRSYPMDDGDSETAERITKWLYRWRRDNNIPFVDGKYLADQFIAGIMVDEGYICYEKDPLGTISNRRGNPLSFMYDIPSATKPDQSNARDMMRVEWKDPEVLRGIISDELVEKYRRECSNSEPDDPSDIDDNWGDASEVMGIDLHDWDDKNIKGHIHAGKVREIEYLCKEYETRTSFYNNTVGTLTKYVDENQLLILETIANMRGDEYEIIESKVPVVRSVYMVGEDVVRNEIEQRHKGYKWHFGIGYDINGLIGGKAVQLHDPQLDFNKRQSQMTHIIGRMAKALVLADEAQIDDKEAAEQTINKTGGVFWYNSKLNDGEGKPPLIAVDGTVNGALFAMKDSDERIIQSISSIPPSAMGFMESSHETGPVVHQRIQQGMAGLAPFISNYQMFMTIRAQKAVWMLQANEAGRRNRLFRILYPESGPEDVMFNEMDEAGNVVAEIAEGEYDVEFVLAGATATHRQMVWGQLMQIAEQTAIPPELLVQYSELPNEEKEKIAEHNQNLQREAAIAQATESLKRG